jgi:hypothetical protein
VAYRAPCGAAVSLGASRFGVLRASLHPCLPSKLLGWTMVAPPCFLAAWPLLMMCGIKRSGTAEQPSSAQGAAGMSCSCIAVPERHS